MSDSIERARKIVHASEWSGDMRVNMTRVIGAGRVLAKAIVELEDRLRASHGGCKILSQGDECDCGLCKRDRKLAECHRLLREAVDWLGDVRTTEEAVVLWAQAAKKAGGD